MLDLQAQMAKKHGQLLDIYQKKFEKWGIEIIITCFQA